ncbi:MAG: ferritin family protein, partial [[Ruminococcus] gnavus]|nr:ferritin family protein [Mediterraneibacter gnavus]
TRENLMRAFAGESQARNRYTIAAEKAREKGMYSIADIFLYTAEQGRWICTNCGYIHDGKQAPSVCPVCRHEKGYFLPYEYAPYKGAENR